MTSVTAGGNVKLLVTGDGAIGKTCLLMAYAREPIGGTCSNSDRVQYYYMFLFWISPVLQFGAFPSVKC